jgi:CheY-like chemotaxis protein/anti-sigma regulatory factor (Ser/Thr protein kinase)
VQWMQERSHSLSVSAGDDPLVVEGDEVRLNQVVQNLLHNAAKYTPQGGRIDVQARREGAEAVVSVKDNGVGMSEELLRSAFELFKQADQGLERSQGGLGVGLTLVEQLVALHGGSVEARSAGPGKGSEFFVRVPLREEPAIVREGAAPARAGPAQRRPSRRRVLVVDDNGDAAQALKLLLETDGHEVRVAADGPAGIALAREYRPDVALLDIGLPGKSGYDVAKEIRADPALAETVLVAVTGYGQLQDRARASAAGFHHHLVKPVEFSALQALLAAPR